MVHPPEPQGSLRRRPTHTIRVAHSPRDDERSATNCVAAAPDDEQVEHLVKAERRRNGFGHALAYVTAPTLYRAPRR